MRVGDIIKFQNCSANESRPCYECLGCLFAKKHQRTYRGVIQSIRDGDVVIHINGMQYFIDVECILDIGDERVERMCSV